jgi:HJR/Mrr/RecB family endonuclease
LNTENITSITPNPGPSRRLYKGEAKSLIESQLTALNDGLLIILSRYQPHEAARTWHRTIRAIEEFINIPLFGIKDPHLIAWLSSIRLDDLYQPDGVGTFRTVRKALSEHLEDGVVQRYQDLLMQTAAIAQAFKINLQPVFGEEITLDTVGAAVRYFMSRRRHLLSLLYTMPYACRGTEMLVPLDALNVLLPVVELNCVPIISYHLKLAHLEIFENFSLEVDEIGARASHWFDMLDTSFLEPERASIMVMAELRHDQFVLPEREPLDPRKIFSAAELRNSADLVGATYAAFDLNDSDFAAMTQLVKHLSRFCQDDYYIEIGKQKLRAILRTQSILDPDELERLLVNIPSDYATSTNAYEPFIDLGDTVISNVNLLSRFLYAFKNVHLDSRRRFQIHAGFIFEDMVKRDLSGMGFQVTNIKRVNHKEFDVVATHDGVIYNFQCKNNWIDLAKLEAQRALYVRYNRSLTNYYKRALAKEANREHLLEVELGLSRVEHYVISRFPVITADPRIISYNRIGKLSTIIGAMDSSTSVQNAG